jgi:hypothetical protein
MHFRGVSNSRGYRVIRRLAYVMGHLVACAALLATDEGALRAVRAGPPSSTAAENFFWRRDGHVSRLRDPLPAVKLKFILCSGPRSIVDQFFAHYRHPERDRLRELVQLSTVVSFGAVFPIGLFCSVIWMPPGVSYTWLSYQFYIVLALLVMRYYDYGKRCDH